MPPSKPVICDFALKQISEANVVAMPFGWPGSTGCLLIASGIALCEIDLVDPSFQQALDLWILTNVRIRDDDNYIDSCVFLDLASIAGDDGTQAGSKKLQINAATSMLDSNSRVIRINAEIGLAGDVSISRLSYQLNVLIDRPSRRIGSKAIHNM